MLLNRNKKRPSLNEIDSVLSNQLQPEFASLEGHRKAALYTYGATLAAIVLCTLLAVKVPGFPGTFAIPLLFVGGAALGARSHRQFRKMFKDQVMRKVAAHFFPHLAYEPEGMVGKHLYDESGLFRKELKNYSGNDFFQGKIGEVDFQFSELDCWYETGSGKNRTRHQVFRGFFFVGGFHRDFYFRTLIQPDIAENFLGVLGRGMQRVVSGNRLVDLEDTEFEKLFVVTSDDQVEARYLLTPVMMEKLREFRKRVDRNIHLSFVNGKMILAIETNHDYFEPNLFGQVLNRQDLMKFIDMLSLLLGVAESFLHHPKLAADPPKMPLPPLPKPLLQKKVPPPLPWQRKG